MASNHKIRFYPVGNGDTSQIVLNNGRRILFDYCHRKIAEDQDDPRIDLAASLKCELKAANQDYFDVVAFTHADDDHISYSTDFFWLNIAATYQSEERIKINELWVPAAMLLEPNAIHERSAEFAIWKREAWWRLISGTGIRVFSKPPALEAELTRRLADIGLPPTARDELFVDAGTLVPGFSLEQDGVEFFCHSPFRKHCEDGSYQVRNQAALVFNVRFRAATSTFDFLQIGDTEAHVLDDIVKVTQYHGNEDRLQWDLFNLPHHCSYGALSDKKGLHKTIPLDGPKFILQCGKPHSYMVSSSCPIGSDQSAYEQIQPPHVQAKNTYEEYLALVGGRKLLVTMAEPSRVRPEPIEFNVSEFGIALTAARIAATVSTAVSRPARAG